MISNRNRIVGIALLAIVAVVMVLLLIPPPTPTPTIVSYSTSLYVYGGYRYFEDPEIMAILHDRYSTDVTGDFRLGTFDMSDEYKEGVDCIFPGSKAGIDYFEQQHPGVIRRAEPVFQSPIMVYTWRADLPTLEDAGLIHEVDGVYTLRMEQLIQAMLKGDQWSDLGINIPGYVSIVSTDPLTSSSGVMWLAIIGGYLVPGNESGGKIMTVDELKSNHILPALVDYWEHQGYQIGTTGDLFHLFISTGPGMPMIVAYENSYINWYHTDLPDDRKSEAQKIVGLYPENTITTEHSLASLTEKCDQLLEIFTSDADIQRLAWENQGMRNLAGGIGEKPGNEAWIAATVPYIPEPKQAVIDVIRGELCKHVPDDPACKD